MNLPLLAGMMILYFSDIIFASYLFFGLVGVSNGLSNVLGSSTWAEVYGVKYLGGIKALTASYGFSTAFGTAIFGALIDNGLAIEQILLIGIIYVALSLFFYC